MPSQRPPKSAPLALFSLVKIDGRELGKPPEQVNIFGTYTDGDKDAELSKYPSSRQEKFAKQVVNPKKFVTSDKVVTLEEIPSDK